MYYWITYKDASMAASPSSPRANMACCVDNESMEGALAELKEKIPTAEAPFMAMALPYPSAPRPWPKTDMPNFCYSPDRCKGRTSCPRYLACTD